MESIQKISALNNSTSVALYTYNKIQGKKEKGKALSPEDQKALREATKQVKDFYNNAIGVLKEDLTEFIKKEKEFKVQKEKKKPRSRSASPVRKE